MSFFVSESEYEDQTSVKNESLILKISMPNSLKNVAHIKSNNEDDFFE